MSLGASTIRANVVCFCMSRPVLLGLGALDARYGGNLGYILKALEKGFSDMYGSWGGRCPHKKDMEAPRLALSDFRRISGEIGGYFPIPVTSIVMCVRMVTAPLLTPMEW